MTETKEDRVIQIGLMVAYAGLALQIAAVTAYIPLGIIGPDPTRETLLLWVMPLWIVSVTVGMTFVIRHYARKWLA